MGELGSRKIRVLTKMFTFTILNVSLLSRRDGEGDGARLSLKMYLLKLSAVSDSG